MKRTAALTIASAALATAALASSGSSFAATAPVPPTLAQVQATLTAQGIPKEQHWTPAAFQGAVIKLYLGCKAVAGGDWTSLQADWRSQIGSAGLVTMTDLLKVVCPTVMKIAK